ncbi:MAG: TetR/AcrR family transcriptional regulator [Gammaproteobacteria bacterium]|nr:TetR/AcrR family transcriptional regulator [Gammaproteobacteria bacterium]
MVAQLPRKLTQEERTAQSDRSLIDAAIALIIEKGTEGTTLLALGERSGYSRGLVTYRFGTKSGLFKAVIKQVSDRWIKTLESAVGRQTGAAAIMACFDAYYGFVQQCPDDIRALNILNQRACEPGSELRDIVCKVVQKQMWQVNQWVTQGQADGTITAALDGQAFAAQFIASHRGITALWMLDDAGCDWQRLHMQSRNFLDHQLQPS